MATSEITLVDYPKKKLAKLVQKESKTSAHEKGKRTKDSLRASDLPIVLAGPVLRKVTTGAVYVWLATSIKVTVNLKVWQYDDDTGIPKQQHLGDGWGASFAIGSCLHVTLVECTPLGKHAPVVASDQTDEESVWSSLTPQAFPSDVILGYNGTIHSADPLWEFEGDTALHRADVCLTDFTVVPFDRPTFVIPSKGQVRFLHASCRKFHGQGRDATPHGLEQLEKHGKDPALRPAYLFLTGDQIYADDVHDDLIGNEKKLRKLALRLMGRRESLPGVSPVLLKIGSGKRGEMVRDGGFTANQDECRNHLLGLGEYAAMYLLAWSPVMWSKYGADFDNKSKEMRILLANVATYMMFDDHDVTDDWNITHEWRDNVASDVRTKRVVSNGLAAFFGFQAIGNDPGRAEAIQNGLAANPTAHDRSDEVAGGDPRDVNSWDAFDLGMWFGFSNWSFTATAHPPVVVIDTRTQRHLEENPTFNFQKVPGLLNEHGLKWLQNALGNLSSDSSPVFIVSPAPVIGYGVEELQRIKASVDTSTKPLDLSIDPEAWSFNSRTFVAFLDLLLSSGHDRFVFLSGDVHYGFTAIGRYRRRRKKQQASQDKFQTVQLVQFTSSPTCNEMSHLQRKKTWILDKIVNDDDDLYIRYGWDPSKSEPDAIPHIIDPHQPGEIELSAPWDFEIQWRYVPVSGESTTLVKDNNMGLVDLNGSQLSQTLVTRRGARKFALDLKKLDKLLKDGF